MPSNGRDFPGKVCPMAFSNCRRPRKGRNIAPGGLVFCLPSGAITYHQLRFILTAPSQGSWKCSVSAECEMTLSGKYKCHAYAEKNGMPRSPRKRMPLPPPRNARVPGTTYVISGTPGHCWLNKKRQRPTLPPGGAVPSARAGLTSLFGMGRGGSPLLLGVFPLRDYVSSAAALRNVGYVPTSSSLRTGRSVRAISTGRLWHCCLYTSCLSTW